MVNKGAYVEPWTRQKDLQKRFIDEEVPDIEELVEIIEGIQWEGRSRKFYTKRARALFAMYYLTACRASEIVKTLSLRKQSIVKVSKIEKDGTKRVYYKTDSTGGVHIERWVDEHTYLGIIKKDIQFRKIDGRLCMLVRTENRKNARRKTKRQPIPIDLEMPIVNYITDYTKRIPPNNLLFPFQTKWATQIINKTTDFNIHFIRHIRATHLVTKYDFNEQMLIKFMGWTDGRPAKHYMELKSQDLFRQFYKRG